MPLTKEQLEKLAKTTPIDDLAIRFMLRDNLELAELLCQTVLEETGLRVKSVRTQYDASRGGIARAITMDVVIFDERDRVHNYEVQMDLGDMPPERVRYHCAVLDVEFLDAGQDFADLPDTFVVILCNHDPFGKGDPLYYVKRTVYRKSGEVLEEYKDRQLIIYVNGDWRGDDALGRLMQDFHCKNPDDMYYAQMAEPFRTLTETREGQMYLTGLAADFYNDGLAEGEARGKAEGRQALMTEMIKAGVDPAIFAQVTGMSIEEIRETVEQTGT